MMKEGYMGLPVFQRHVSKQKKKNNDINAFFSCLGDDVAAQGFDKLQASHARHDSVGNHDIWRGCSYMFESLFAIRDNIDVICPAQ
jgi:hypothetical protein